MKSTRHLIRCRCFQRHISAELFQFTVFSVHDDDENVKIKFVQCPNCGIVHRVHEIGKSQIMNGKEHMNSIVTIEDVKHSLDPKLVSIIETHDIVDVSLWEEVQFIVREQLWGSFVVLARERESKDMNVKLLKIISPTMSIVEVETRSVML